jgi:hypothetical protein
MLSDGCTAKVHSACGTGEYLSEDGELLGVKEEHKFAPAVLRRQV